jgi:AraC-like DNA-binding protein
MEMGATLPSSFLSPKDEHRPEGRRLLWAVSGRADEPLPPAIHIHRGVEVGVILAGIEEVHYGTTVLTCSPGDVWLCSVYEPHGARLVTPPRHSVVLIFLPEFIGRESVGGLPWPTLFAVPPEERPSAYCADMRRRTLEIGRVLCREIEQQRPQWESVVRLELLRLLTELSREWTVPAQTGAQELATVDGLDRILPALSLVHSLPWRKVGVSEAAAACGLGLSRFHALFRSTMGVSFGEFGLRARLTFAAHRLSHSHRTISAIAAEAGFVDDSHLHRHFVRLYGCTPAQYRVQDRTTLFRPATSQTGVH